jgi:predicted RNA-binding protein with PIN domain
LVRPALEAAVVVAQQIDVAEVPSPLRQFLHFTRLPPRALTVARRVLDGDDAFRARVRSLVDEATVGEAGWLVLDRPEGWESSLQRLVDAAELHEAEADAASDLRRARREIDKVRGALARAESSAADARAALERSRVEVDDERAARRRAEARIDALEAQVARLGEERTRAVRELKVAEARATERANELREAKRRTAAAEAAADRPTALPGDADSVGPGGPGSTRPSASEAPPVPTGIDLDALARQIGKASSAASALAEALGQASRSVAPVAEPIDPPPARAERTTRRRPTTLPVGVLDDSVEAARHLVTVKAMMLLVDGYNVSMRGWRELPIALQRDRLVDGLAALAARTGVRPVVVFDASETVDTPPMVRGRAVQVRFAPPDLEADDIIIRAVGDYPASTPVTVVSNDERVRVAARRRGANVVRVEQLLGLL